jgi:hypothetical protein
MEHRTCTSKTSQSLELRILHLASRITKLMKTIIGTNIKARVFLFLSRPNTDAAKMKSQNGVQIKRRGV